LAGFLHCALETRWQRFRQFLHDFLMIFLMISSMKIFVFSMQILNFSMKILDFIYKKS